MPLSPTHRAFVSVREDTDSAELLEKGIACTADQVHELQKLAKTAAELMHALEAGSDVTEWASPNDVGYPDGRN